ncbi:hypothetical protein C2G38_2145533 [Gigaspora rosea]|uniref:Uncharacterized protein n=1 Tax=Gigaspora rosea TaxID=44941 RepID=A0A397US06_9GLOM|nr:hypothetical protein C2G38_2145533 [Gigaspora rosea]
MKSFSKVTITILILIVLLCQFVTSFPTFQKKAPTIQITDENTDILTKHNDIDVNEEYNKINEESLNVFMNMVELPNIEMSEIKSSEIKSSEIDLDPILEKIREAFAVIIKFITDNYIIFIIVVVIIVLSIIFPRHLIGFIRLLGHGVREIIRGCVAVISQSIGGIGNCGAGIGRLFGCDANGAEDGCCVVICQSFSDICVGGLKLLPVIVVVVGLTMLYLYITDQKEPENLII